MMDIEQIPLEVRSASTDVQTAYRFAAANPDAMKQIRCYCGCDSLGHALNYDCYVSDVDATEGITFDNHALACSTCVDIASDVMRMLRQGKTPQEARLYIDETYGKFAAPPTP